MNEFEIFNETNEIIKELETVRKVLNHALEYEKVNDSIFNVIIIDNERIHKMNREYRNVDRPTDVISFALEDNIDIKTEIRMLGDIYISIDKAREQALEYGHSLERELCFLSVHGLLHLLGYDHMKKDDEEIMFSKQREILDSYGIVR